MPLYSTACPIPINRKIFRHRGSVSPIPQSGLSLWLKADAGVTISQTPIITQVILTGFTGIYSNCNGTYNGSDGYYEIAGGAFYIDGNTLYDSNYEVEIAVNNNNYQGAWTPSTYLRTITLSNAGTTSANGVYTRADSQIDMRFVAFSKSGGSITWDYDNGFWYTSQDLYRNYTLDFSNDWDNQNGQGPQPDDAFSNSNRNVGSPTSTITSIYPVESWADQSVNSGALSINNGFASSVVISGKNFISFPSNTDLYSDNPIWADSQIIGTIFCVSRFASSSSGSTALLLRHQGTEGEFRLGRGFNNTNAFFITNDGIDNVSSLTNANNNTNYLLGATFDESLVATLYLNGASTGSGSITNSNGQYNFNVGGLEPSNIAEIVVYNRVLTTPERQQVEAYLNSKYSIY